MTKKHKDSSWKNVRKYNKGKERLKHAILQHPEENADDTSIFNYMVNQVRVRREYTKIVPFGQYEKMGKGYPKVSEDMLGPMDSPSYSPTMLTPGPGTTHQTPATMPSDMDTFSLVGPGKKQPKKNKKKKGKKEKKLSKFDSGKVLTFADFINSK